MPTFAPPKPTQPEDLRAILEICAEDFTAKAFQAGLRAAFVNACLVRDPKSTPPSYRRFTGHTRKGLIPKVLAPADSSNDDEFQLGDVAAEVEMVTRPSFEEADFDIDIDADE